MLHSGSDKGGNTGVFKTAVIDTLVAEVQSVPGDGECRLLLVSEYRTDMYNLFLRPWKIDVSSYLVTRTRWRKCSR
jgi:hypothetical protein